ncbi:MAG: hypothetical protein GX606_01660 [Elusimicrobia bacterium]|nr:hypothetical protein [Elusimicrobiota bacterium]
MLWLIVGTALAAVGALIFLFFSLGGEAPKKTRRKKTPPPEPVKDWPAIVDRLERKAHTLQRDLQISQNEVRGRDLEINDLKAKVREVEKHLAQEKTWREKEEADLEKEKKQERLLKDELMRVRDILDSESTQRIRLEQELKPLRAEREEKAAEVRRLSAKEMDLERRLREAEGSVRSLRQENAELKRKKEDEEWVAKSDFRRIESLLKRARWEVDQFKKAFPAEQWPKALRPKPQPTVPAAVPEPSGAAPSASPAAGPSSDSERPQGEESHGV